MWNVGFKFDYCELMLMGDEFICYKDLGDIKFEIDYWKLLLVCYVLGVNLLVSVFF